MAAKPRPVQPEAEPRPNDLGTPERRQKGDLYAEESDTILHMRSNWRPPLDKYFREGVLDPRSPDNNRRLFRAGCNLRRAWRAAGYTARITIDLTKVPLGGSSRGEMADRVSDARREVVLVLREVGPVLAGVVRHVVCLDGTAGEWAKAYGWHRARDGMVALRLGLDSVARHYRL